MRSYESTRAVRVPISQPHCLAVILPSGPIWRESVVAYEQRPVQSLERQNQHYHRKVPQHESSPARSEVHKNSCELRHVLVLSSFSSYNYRELPSYLRTDWQPL